MELISSRINELEHEFILHNTNFKNKGKIRERTLETHGT